MRNGKNKVNPHAWIAAIYERKLPMEMTLGDGTRSGGPGGFINRPFLKNHVYRVFVRAFSDENVSLMFCKQYSS